MSGRILLQNKPKEFEGLQWCCSICGAQFGVVLINFESFEGGLVSMAFCRMHLVDLRSKIESVVGKCPPPDPEDEGDIPDGAA